jgi:formylglycine-generating enzyme required for sulfatase activity
LGLGFLRPESLKEVFRAFYRLRKTRQALCIAGCEPRWRPVVEIALALALLPERIVRVTGPGLSLWREFLDGSVVPREGEPEAVWVVRNVEGESFGPALSGLNFHRDDFLKSGTRVWLWVLPEDIDTLAHMAPDLWRFRSAVLALDVSAVRRIQLPHYVPRVPWPRLDIELLPIQPGSFMMGSPESEAGRFDNEDQHQVVLTRAFFLQTTPVTQSQFEQVMGFNPSYFKNAGLRAPVEQVSWYEAIAFCNELSRQQGLSPAYVLHDIKGQPVDKDYSCRVEWKGLDHGGYRLPTEAEWEYACRAGTKTATYNGDLTVLGENNAPELDQIAWYSGNSGVDYEGSVDSSGWPQKQYPHTRAGTHPVGLKKANKWGGYDMLGNVYEWVWDGYGAFGSGTAEDPTGPEQGSLRVFRGGSWNRSARRCRAANRDNVGPGYRSDFLGFRLARSRDSRSSDP